MTPRKLDVFIATYSYGGNGGMKSEHPDVRDYLMYLQSVLLKDNRIGNVGRLDYADTPITMTRNKSVLDARRFGFDLLLMIDSDMAPDAYPMRPGAKPFFESSFDFIYKHYDKGPVVVGAPYSGPPPEEIPYIFQWVNHASDLPEDSPDMELKLYSRFEAGQRGGIEEVAALPTGLILWDVRCFDLTEPADESEHSWFYYEYTDKYQTQKGSTEDVTATRDISLAGIIQLGYNPVYVNWDAWAGHWKPKRVGPPEILSADSVGKKLARAAREGINSDERRVRFRSDAADTFVPTSDEEIRRLIAEASNENLSDVRRPADLPDVLEAAGTEPVHEGRGAGEPVPAVPPRRKGREKAAGAAGRKKRSARQVEQGA